jgi:cell division septum initiation protein DivIVA
MATTTVVPQASPATVEKQSDGVYAVRVQHTLEGSVTFVQFHNHVFGEALAYAYAAFLNGEAKVKAVVAPEIADVDKDAKAVAKGLIADAKTDASKLVADAEKEAEAIKAEAEKVLADAKVEAAKLIADAKAEAAKVVPVVEADAKAAVTDVKDEVEKL